MTGLQYAIMSRFIRNPGGAGLGFSKGDQYYKIASGLVKLGYLTPVATEFGTSYVPTEVGKEAMKATA